MAGLEAEMDAEQEEAAEVTVDAKDENPSRPMAVVPVV